MFGSAFIWGRLADAANGCNHAVPSGAAPSQTQRAHLVVWQAPCSVNEATCHTLRTWPCQDVRGVLWRRRAASRCSEQDHRSVRTSGRRERQAAVMTGRHRRVPSEVDVNKVRATARAEDGWASCVRLCAALGSLPHGARQQAIICQCPRSSQPAHLAAQPRLHTRARPKPSTFLDRPRHSAADTPRARRRPTGSTRQACGSGTCLSSGSAGCA